MLFSQRKGMEPIKNVVQVDSIDNDLLNGLWNVLIECYWNSVQSKYFDYNEEIHIFQRRLCLNYFKTPLDTIELDWGGFYSKIRSYFFDCAWNKVYDFMEFIVKNYPDNYKNDACINKCNYILKRELSAYRFVGGQIVQITSQEEISTIEEALNVPNPYKTVNIHIKTALILFSDKKSPDYRNSIKESISAVESICKLITKKKNPTLSQALNILKKEIGLHSALEKAFNSLYGYASDEEGIRHGLFKETELYSEDAKFMLVSCSAFVNYLVSKISKTELKI